MTKRNPMPVWIICPNLWGARVLRYGRARLSRQGYDGGEVTLEFIRELLRPTVHTKLEDFPDEDQIERVYQPVEDPEKEEEVANDYMAFVSRELREAFERDEFESLVLCAEPHLLRILESKLDEELKHRVIGKVPFDHYETNESDLEPYIVDILNRLETSGRGAA